MGMWRYNGVIRVKASAHYSHKDVLHKDTAQTTTLHVAGDPLADISINKTTAHSDVVKSNDYFK